MDKVSICHGCGRTMDASFQYCPWCGASVAPEPLSERVEAIFSRIETMQYAYTGSRIDQMENKLGELENDLSVFLSGSSAK